MSLFYSVDVSSGECILPEGEATHALRVLRLTQGDRIQITNGKGRRYEGILSTTDIQKCKVDIVQEVETKVKRSYKLHVAIAPTKKNSRFEWFLEKACEIGIDTITPLICEHSERRNMQVDRWRKILIAAMKQSNQDVLPILNPMVTFEEFLSDSTIVPQNSFLASYGESNKDLSEMCKKRQDILIMIGPEGDFSDAERGMADTFGIASVNMGITRLRTETAGIVAVHTVSLLNSAIKTY